MKVENKLYCDVSKVTVREISSSVAKEIIVKKHYTHAWTMCRYALGIFYKTDEVNALGDNEKLIGCLVYGFPVGARAATSISELLTKDNVLELTRLYCDDGYGSNIESYAIGQSFKWFKENDKAISDITKKMKEYLKSGSKEMYEANPTKFPKGNGQDEKGDVKAYHASDAVDEYIEAFAYPGMTNLVYDEIKPEDEKIEKQLKGHKLNGNAEVDESDKSIAAAGPQLTWGRCISAF